MSGLPRMSRTIRGLSRSVAFLITAPWSSSMKSIRSVLPNPSRTALSNSGNVGAAAVLFANATMSGWPIAALIAASILSNARAEIRLNRSTSTVAIIPPTFLATFDKRGEYLGPVFLEGGVALQSAFQHLSYTVLSFRPPERCSKRSEGVEEPIERRQRDFVNEMLCRNESAPIEGSDPACEGIDEAVQLGVRKGPVHIAISFRCVAIEVVGTQNDFERPPTSHQVRKALCASAARMQADSEFRVTELRVLTRGEAHVAGKNELAAHAAHTAPDSCEADDRCLG